MSFQAALKASRATARLQNINCTVRITRWLGRWERVPPAGGSLGPQCSLVGPVRMTESFTGPIITLRSCPAAFGPLSTCVAWPLSSRSAPGEALPDPTGANRLHGSQRRGGACFSTVLDSLQFSDETQRIHVSPRGKKRGDCFIGSSKSWRRNPTRFPTLRRTHPRRPGPGVAMWSIQLNAAAHRAHTAKRLLGSGLLLHHVAHVIHQDASANQNEP